MKKIITCLAVALCSTGAFAQYYFNTYNPAGMNPGGLNNDAEQPLGFTAGYTSVLAHTTTLSWSAVQALPFAFNFNGSPVTHYKVSNSGVLTFDTTATSVPPTTNVALPSATVPDKSICIWGLAMTVASTNDAIGSKTFGSAPNRQHWVDFLSFSSPTASGSQWTYWGIVLEETTNKIYIVDKRTYNTPLALTVGIQVDATNAYQIATAPNTPSFVTNGGSASDPTDNVYYEFIQGTRPTDDVEMISLNLTSVTAGSPNTISGSLKNSGSDTLTSVNVSWTVDGGTTVNTSNLSVSVPPLATANFTHPTAWTPMAGAYVLEVYADSPNGNTDPNAYNDTISTSVVAPLGNSVSRNPLLEEFTTAPCQFCPDGAVEVEAAVLATPATIPVGVHACFSTDAMTIPEASEYCAAFGAGAPTACVDRILFPGESNVAFSRANNAWRTRTASQAAAGAPVDITLSGSYDPTTRLVTLDATSSFVDYVLPGDIRVTLMVIEDHVRGVGSGYDQVNYYNTVAGHPYFGAGNPITNYDHRHVLRDVYPTTDAWGDNSIIPSNPALNTPYTKSHSFTLDAAWDADSVSFACFVSYYDPNEVGAREILNASDIKLSTLVGLNKVSKDAASLSIYPNPSNGMTNVEVNLENAAPLSVKVFDVAGKELLFENYGVMAAGNQRMQFDVSDFANGIYYVNLQIGEEVITKKISVVK